MFQKLQACNDPGHDAQEIDVGPEKKAKEQKRNDQVHQSIMDRAFHRYAAKVPVFEYPVDMASVEMDYPGAFFLNTGQGPSVMGLNLIG